MFATGDAAGAIMEREGLKQISDTGALEKRDRRSDRANPKQVEQYQGGKTTVIGFLVGQVMRATRGQANVAVVTEILKRKLGRRRTMLKEGDKAPDIIQRTRRDSLSAGKRVVLYFYPKADTPGCTIESCEFRDTRRSSPGKARP